MPKEKSTVAIIEEKIIDEIYLVRRQKVMIDRDIAELYGVETKRLKEQVNRNLNRFPSHYMFELTQQEYESLRSQNAALKQGGYARVWKKISA